MDTNNSAVDNKESQNISVLLWVLTLFFGFIPGLIMFFVKKEDPYILHNSKEALNWSITAIIAYFVGVVTSFLIIGIFVIAAVMIMHLIVCIKGAIKASKGDQYRAPFTIRLIS